MARTGSPRNLLLGLVCCSTLQSAAIAQHGPVEKQPTPPGPTRLQDERTPDSTSKDSTPNIDQMIEQATAPSSKAAEDASLPAPDTEANSEPPTSAIGILTYPFLACLILTGIHCYLGIHVIARGVIFVDLALAQMAALGGVVALLIGLEPHPHGKEPYWLEAWASYSLSLATTLVGAALFATGRLKKQVVPQEAIIGIIYAVSSALALLLLSKAPSEQAEETKHMLVGRLLFVQDYEVWKMAALYAGVGLFHWIFRQRFLAISLHPELAQEQGMAVRWWDFLFYTSFGVVVTSSVRMAGVLLVFSFLIVPAVCATLLARNIGTRLVVGWAIGFMASVLGLSFSVLFDLPTGESVVTAFGGLLAIVALARWVLPRTAT